MKYWNPWDYHLVLQKRMKQCKKASSKDKDDGMYEKSYARSIINEKWKWWAKSPEAIRVHVYISHLPVYALKSFML
jgi:hypothetical protein